MDALHTIGYTKKNLRDFITRLKSAGVDCVVDIRLHNTSQLAGFAKKEDLEFILDEGFGIRYAHDDIYAPTEDLLDRYKKTKDWGEYVGEYLDLIEKRNMVTKFLETAAKRGWKKPCLLCAEDKPDQCHRRLLAEAIVDRADGLEVIHL